MVKMMLTVKKIDSAKKKDKAYKLQDSGNLYLYISTIGTKSWRMDYKFNGKRKTLTIGKYPIISLAKAREERELAKKLLLRGIDPSKEKKCQSLHITNSEKNTFKNIALEWHNAKKSSWSKKYANGIITIFNNDIFPHIGSELITEIKPLQMLAVLRKIEIRGALELANKARMRCSEVFRYAILTGRSDNNPAGDLSNAMINRTPKNYPFLTEFEMISFLKELEGYSGNIISRLATKVLIYTATRTIEMRNIKWSNVDFEQNIIIIPAEIVKKNRVHIIPISNQVKNILNFLKPITGESEYVFSGRNNYNKPISEGTILGIIKRLGFVNRASGHGFRHQFSTVLNENGFNKDWIEKQLNHETGSVRGIYNHAQYLSQRHKMMQWYSDYIDKLSES